MRAARITEHGGADKIHVESNLPVPVPTDSQIQVKVAYAGVNYIDTYHRTGLYSVPLPFILGREGSGVVTKVGKDVNEFKEGDRVAWAGIAGSYSEYVAGSASTFVHVPADCDLRSAAAVMLQGMTAHYLSHSTYPIQKGDYVLVHAAAGGTGSLLVQMAKLRGAIVIATVSNDEKAKKVRQLGADHVIDYTKADFRAEVANITGGKGCQVVYDGVGKSTWEGSMKSVRKCGYLVFFGNASGPVPPIDPLQLTSHGSIYLSRPTMVDYIDTREKLLWRTSDLFNWISQKQLSVSVAHEVSLDTAAKGHELIQSRDTAGKVLIAVNTSL